MVEPKLFLTLAIVFVAGTVMNANNTSDTVIEEWPTMDCIQMAFDAGIVDYDTFDRVVSACEAM